MSKLICRECRFWGDGDGTGFPYDAGHVNICRHPQIDGDQHPSYGACYDLTSMVMVDTIEPQRIQTRWNFGCILHVDRK